MKLDLPFATWSGVVLLLYILQNAASSTTTTTSTKNIAYLNHTTQLILPDTWSLRSFTQLSFRTCSPNGGLLSQQDNTEFINLRLQNGSIVLSWNVANNTATFRVAGVFSNNMWYIVGLRFYLGNVNLTVARGQTLLYDRVVASMASSLHQYLFSNELNSAQLEVGKDFVGCIYQGPGVNFNQPGIIETGVVWNNCLLSSRPGCSLADLDGDDCIQLPCKNGGTCRDGIGNYTCECRHNFNGTNCENDLRYLGCDIAPCMNQGTCLPLQGTTTGVPYTCNCANGYTGTDCELVIDDCRSQPCNYGACTNLVGNGYSCDCTGTGYNGQNCSTDIDECLTVDCGNGTCYNFPGSFTCQCGIGFNGDRCQDKIDECRSSPCQNDGTCSNLIDRFNCTCKTGFTGVTCETNIDDCVGVLCQSSNAECKDLVNNHRCDCKDGFTGTDPNCVDINECASNPCVSGQSISCDNLENRYFCRCSAGFTGERCEIDINECARNPCQNNASCTQGINMYTCHCLPGFTDHNCSTNINECGSNPCRNGGSCNDQVAGYTCDCVTGWTGSDCSVNFNDCESNPCLNDGTCDDYLAYYNCSCILGFEGDRCDSNINDCLINPCLNNAQCVDLVNDYRCDCAPNWMGKNCSLTYNACNALTPCKNGATCTTQEPSLEYNCSCQVGFSGVNCSHNIDDCLINICQSYQQCYDLINNYTCGCPPGLEGDLCNVDVDECANNQCRNGAVCINGTGVYTCSCKNTFYNLTQYAGRKLEFYSGYEGEFCGVDINECDYSPCLNGGQCTNSDGGYSCLCSQKDGPTVGFNCELKTSYCDVEAGKLGRPPCSNGGTCISSIREFTCVCAPGWTGATCNININECESNPCQYNGSCNDQVNGYNCTCIPGITGPNCETNINECLSNPCQNNGACLDQINQYICNCSDTGFVGINCDVDILECLSNPCQHGSTCKDGIKMYECECYSGYNGTNCQLDIKECDLKPCQYGGTCLEYSNQTLYELGVPGFTDFSYATAAGYKCNCIPGITGPNCDVNIDECASNPCKNGATCNDGINQYQCACVPGYTGLHCETDINECTLYDACQNGATCKDLVNDYRCDCIPYARSAGGFGGKNCSVRLTGCDSGSLCQHGSSCVPFYTDSTNIHGYTCDCPPGYTGQYCQHSTSFTVKNNGFVKSKTSQSVSMLSFRFRTSLDKGILMTFQPSVSQAGYLIIQILNSKLKVEYQNQTSVTIDSMAVNDKNWHQVQITLGQQIKVSLDSSLCYQVSDCTTSIANQWTVPVEGHLYFGMSDTSVLASRSPYIGCMDDVVVNDFVVYEEGTNFYFNVEKGCPRTEQCGPYTCSRHGDCKDLWYKYECDCTRPYLGTNCSEEYTPATFAKDDMNSFATFNIPSELKNDLQNEVDLSFFIQTRQDDGMIMYVGNTASETSLTFITMEMTDGKLGGRLFFCNSRQTFSSESEYKNGEKHFVQMTIKSGIFSMVIKNDVVNRTIANYENCVLKSDMMYFGGETPDLSTSIGRRKRAINDADLKDFSTTPGFEGIIQDVQVNDKKFEFFASNPSSNSILVATAANLTEGATSTRQICMNETCENGGTCTEQVFNDFRCDCQAGYIGKNCSNLDFCNSAPCPANSRCQSRIDGYECIAEATFNGRNSLVKYEPKVQDTTVLSILSLSLRTHSEYAAIFYLEHGETFLKLRLEDGNVRMNYKLNERMSETLKFDRNHPVNTGDWFQIEVEFQVGEIVLRIRENKTILEEKSVNVANLDVAAMIRDGAMILLGGLDVVTYARGWEQPFKGCLRDVRVGDILLPFFSDNQFVNNTSKDKFLATDIRIQGIGCDNGQACLRSQSMCLHNSLCINTWNDFKCDCSSGYEGSYCQTDIDECTSDPSQCSPNGKCVDGIGFSSCSCRKGYEGNSCQTDINFCKNDSCENGGSCYEQDTDYGCNCSNEWTGRNCNILVNSSCNDVPCKNGGSCQTINLTTSSGVIESFNCTCMDGYHGPTCEQMIDLCVDVPCSNNATCNPLPSTYECICQPGFTGVRCETNIDDCTSNGCENGDCQDGLNGYYCNCTEGWTGKYCNEDVDECNTTTPCQRGVCINTQGGFYCNCNGTGYNGTNCADEVDECSLVPAQCKNGANCTNTEGSYNCSCTLGYTGDDCDIPDCNANQCENNSTCQVKDQKWMCQCLEYYFGDQCETAGPCTYGYCDDINTNICQQDEVTMNYTCVCKQGWEGENCTKDIDECLNPSTCLNGATCNNLNGSYTCDCVPGYTGYNCGSDINECLTNQCLNGGTCNDYLNYFNCTCTAGYKGDKCGEDVDECLSTPCKNNQPCINSEGSFSCNCSENYLGNLCQHNNPCDLETCQNGGLCKTNVTEDNNYVPFCECVNGYEGARCERADPSKQPVDDSVNIWAIIGPIIAILVIIIIIVAVVFFRMARKKRATRGQYCPSQQENAGARVELGNVLKKPPQERLI